LPTLIPAPADNDETLRQLAWCLAPGDEQDRRRAIGRTGIGNAHTYAHRLAAIASAAGLNAVPAGRGASATVVVG
jgi:hypothetical protein